MDGTWGYRGERGYRSDPRYVSHAHGWSSGPTAALTEYLVGLKITGVQGSEWVFRPVVGVGGVNKAEAGFVTGLGGFRGGFSVKEKKVFWDAPEGTRGWVQVEGLGIEGRWVEGGRGELSLNLD